MSVGIDHFDTGGNLEITRSHLAGAFGRQVQRLGVMPFHADHNPLDVEDDVDDVFDYARDGGELMLDTLDLYRGNRGTRNTGEQGAAERVTERVPETRFQRFDDDSGTDIRNRFFFYLGTLND
jgi:hypothetical protein